jgi:signal transduction protein with GAF and PtsI domain
MIATLSARGSWNGCWRPGRALVAELDLESVLSQLLETARDLTGARYAALGILTEDKHELQRFLTLGVDEMTRRIIGPLARGHGLLGELIRTPKPLRLKDVADHPLPDRQGGR